MQLTTRERSMSVAYVTAPMHCRQRGGPGAPCPIVHPRSAGNAQFTAVLWMVGARVHVRSRPPPILVIRNGR